MSVVLPHALDLPIFKKLNGRRIVLASASPRRKDILEKAVGQGPFYTSFLSERWETSRTPQDACTMCVLELILQGLETRNHRIEICRGPAKNGVQGPFGRLPCSDSGREGVL